jgi:inosine/xanthosine triphosphate pyrophosphatase family protein
MNEFLIVKILIISSLLISCERENSEATESAKKTAQIKFSISKVNIGKFKSGTSQNIEFYAKNITEIPLLIDTMQASCACTVGKFPKYPILKNDSGLIVVTFKPKPGVYGYFEKSIVVSANTKPNFTVLTIEGEIVP